MLHYKEDTYIDSNSIGFTSTVLYGKPNAMGYTPTWSTQMLFYSDSDTVLGSGSRDGLWVLVPEQCGRDVLLRLAQAGDPGPSGEVVVEYVSSVDSNYSITGWSRLQIISDGTNGFTQSRVAIRWMPPSDWKWCIPNPPH